MLMLPKRNGEIKSRGVANGSLQMIRANKSDCTSLTPDFHSLKHAVSTAAKEERDAATVDLLGHFLKTEANDSE